MFLNKIACRTAQVLDIDDYPFDGFVHDPKKYLLYYDPIYYIANILYLLQTLLCALSPF